MKFLRLISRGLASAKPVMVTQRSLASSAGIVSCDIEDIAIPDLTWSQMCFSRLDRFMILFLTLVTETQ